MQFFRQRHQVDGLLAFAQRDHLRKHPAVLVQKKIFGPQMFDGGIQRVVIQQDGAENRTLGIQIIGQGFFENSLYRHGLLTPDSGNFAFSSPGQFCSIFPCPRQEPTKLVDAHDSNLNCTEPK